MYTRQIFKWCCLILLLLALALAALLPGSVPASHAQSSEPRCFDETGFCISGRIREYWEQNDGLRVFGLPISPQRQENIEGQPLQVQWFERNRLELHPENAPPYDVLLGRLGADVLEARGRNWFTFTKDGEPAPGCRAFETGFNVCGEVLEAWRANGLELDGVPGTSEAESLALFGQPISPLQTEVIDGQTYEVQWFERARFERHPENAPPFDVLFGLLGNVLRPRDVPIPPGRIAFLGINQAPSINGNAIYTMQPDGTDPQIVTTPQRISRTDEWFLILDYDWSLDGDRFAFTATSVWDCTGRGCYSEPNIYTVAGDGTNQSRLTNEGTYGNLTLAPNGSQLAFIGDSIILSDPFGTQRRELSFEGTGLYYIESLILSPTGRHIAFIALSDPSAPVNEYDVYVARTDGSSLVRVLENIGGNLARLAWSPDGTLLAINSDVNSGGTFYTVNADGTGLRKLLTHNGLAYGPHWSPDGTRLLFYEQVVVVNEGVATASYTVFMMQADGSGLTPLADGFYSISSIDWSPDGRRVVMSGAETAEPDSNGIYLFAVDDPQPTRIIPAGVDPLAGGGGQVYWRLTE
jgi:Tol biopolymer transport system component